MILILLFDASKWTKHMKVILRTSKHIFWKPNTILGIYRYLSALLINIIYRVNISLNAQRYPRLHLDLPSRPTEANISTLAGHIHPNGLRHGMWTHYMSYPWKIDMHKTNVELYPSRYTWRHMEWGYQKQQNCNIIAITST